MYSCTAGSSAQTGGVSLSESEFYKAGMSLPPDVRKHVALRLLESVDTDEAFDMASESWLRTEAAAAYDALKGLPRCRQGAGDPAGSDGGDRPPRVAKSEAKIKIPTPEQVGAA